jgi:hypothetical protein
MQTRYGYFRIPVPNHKRAGVICVRLDCPNKGDEDPYRAAMCFCSPKDTFSKRLARQLIGFRFENWAHGGDQRSKNVIELRYSDKPPSIANIMREALNKALGMKRITATGQQKPFVPNWITKRVKDASSLQMGMTGGQ